MSELAVVNKGPAPVVEFSVAQEKLLRDTVAQGCDQNEFLLFLEMAKMKRLDPFGGQIRPVKRWDSGLGRDKMTVQVGIDGYRVIAARTGELAGIEDPVYDTEDGDHPKWAKVTVYRYGRGGDKNPYTATARWSEYVQMKGKGSERTPNSMWTKMPYLMLGKVAEALALRKAFPDELSGIYTNEEMAQADNSQPEPALRQAVEMPQAKQLEAKQVEAKVLSAGIISARADGKDNALWVVLESGKRLAIPADKLGSHPFNVGDKIDYTATEKQGKTGVFYILETIHEYQSNVVETLPPMEDGKAEPKAQEESDKMLEEFDQTEPEPQPTGKVIGKSRERRLYTLMSLNKAKTGLNEDIIHKLLKKMPKPVEHLSDLDIGLHEGFEDFMTGKADWKPLLED